MEEAVVRGRLYEYPSGIPVLEVLQADVLAHGTADPLADGPSLYRRVLVPASTRGRRVLVWLYVERAGMRRPARRLADGVWRA